MNNKNWKQSFTIIWSGQLASILSSSTVGFSIIFWLSLETGSAEVLAFAAMAGMLPQAVLGMVAGAYVDRWDRKRTMILADSFIALCTLILAVLFWLDIAQMWHIYVLLACRSVGSAFHMPAMQASVPLLAPEDQLTRIAGINQMISSLSNIAGPALGALLLSLTSIGNILLLDVAGAAIACIALLFVHIPNPEQSGEKHNLLREIREGFAAIGAVRGLATFFTLDVFVFFFIMPVVVLFPLMTIEHFAGGTFEMSLIEIAWGGGALLGGAIMGLRVYNVNRIALINVVNIVIGVTLLLSGLLPASCFILFACLTVIEGIAGGIFNASFVSVMQSRIDSGILGRVLSLYYSLGMIPAIVGLMGTGFLADSVGLALTFILAGAAIAVLGIVGFSIPSVMQLDRRK